MTRDEVLAELEALGTEQTCKIYRNHGAQDPIYGVSFANLGKLQKQIGHDHALAQELWETGNFDARNLALMVADPAQATRVLLNSWVWDLDSYCLADMFARFAATTPIASGVSASWRSADDEWVERAGWDLLASEAMEENDLEDDYFASYIDTIERDIHGAKNYVRHAMNGALIAIGVRSPALKKLAISAARRIGVVEVDHGQTDCKTPDAESYIRKTLEHRAAKAAQADDKATAAAPKKAAAKVKKATVKSVAKKTTAKGAPRKKAAAKSKKSKTV